MTLTARPGSTARSVMTCNPFPTIIFPLFLTTILLIPASLALPYSCPAQALSFERCTATSDCANLSGIFTPPFCAGRNSSGTVLPCGSPGVSLCLCRPFNSHYCRTNLDCLDGEYCAQSSRSGNHLCVSCATHYDAGVGRGKHFDALDYADTATKCKAWSNDDRSTTGGGAAITAQTPPCGSGGDFCSVTLPCATGYACIENIDEAVFKCSYESRRCRCALPAILFPGSNSTHTRFSKSPVSRNNVMFNTCASDNDCDSEREVCALYSTRNENVCVSCDYARTAYDVVPLAGMGKCDILKTKGVQPREQPKMYVEGPNGRSMDRCRTFQHCRAGHRCVREKLLDFGVRTVGLVSGNQYAGSRKAASALAVAARQAAADDVLGELVKCNASVEDLCYCYPDKPATCASPRDCPPGEACVTVPRFNLTNNCASTAFLHALSNRRYDLIGVDSSSAAAAIAAERPPPSMPQNNLGLTDDSCKYDWDCKGTHRRCTHVADLYGRCAGRKQCSCQPLFKQACTKPSDCTTSGETCATTIGTRSKPFCTSAAFVERNPYVYSVNDAAVVRDRTSGMSPTPLPKSNATKGLTGQPCVTTADCKGMRTCVHRFDDMAGEGNRKGCDGSRQGCVCKNIGERAGRQGRCRKSRPYCVEREEVCVMYEDEVPQNRRCVARTAFDEATGLGVHNWVLVK